VLRKMRLLAAGVLVALFAGGCGSGKPATVPVKGKVTFRKSTPPVGALVVFHPKDPEFEKRIGGKPFAKVKEDGTFVLTTFAPNDGAPEGEYGVTIDWRGKPSESQPLLQVGDGGSAGRSMLNPKYGNPQTPAFTVTVKKGESKEFSFDVD
jgi:hypothetical protein